MKKGIYQYISCVLVLLILGLSACSVYDRTSVKNPPAGQPFVFDNQVKVDKSDVGESEAASLQEELGSYWTDSLNANRYRRYGFFYRINNPPVFDTSRIRTTKKLMSGYMDSKGYFSAVIQDTFYIDSVQKANQKRAFVTMRVAPGSPTIIDSVSYSLPDSSIVNWLSKTRQRDPNIRIGKTKLSNAPISAELDRITALYRNNGYYKLTKEDFVAVVDTNDVSLLKMTIDPFQQAVLLANSASKRGKNPTASVDFTKRVYTDSTQMELRKNNFHQYHVGHIVVYPETGVTDIPDSVMTHPQWFPNRFTSKSGNVTIYDLEGKFKPKPILEHLFLRPKDLYNDNQFLKTNSNISNIGAWQQVDTRARLRGDSIVDLYYFLVPAPKYNVSYDFEVSRNTGDFLSQANFGTSSNSLMGLDVNVSLRNRNAFKRAIQSTTSVGGGVELNLGKDNANNALLQTFRYSVGQSFVFPRFITPFKITDRSTEGIRSVLNLSANLQDRRDIFQLGSIVGNWGYEWKNKNLVWQYRPLNMEFYTLTKRKYLDSLIVLNPYIQNAFNTGTIVSQQLNLTITYKDRNHPRNLNYVNVGAEESGTLLGRIKGLQNKFYQYIKLQAEYRKQINITQQQQLAFRAFGGIALNYYKDGKYGGNLPFYKQFYGGGPNSMRAWSLRQIGLGNSLLSDTSGTFRDRYGDMMLEGNVEYRYPIFSIGGMKVKGAVFTDVGNVWDVRNNPDNPDGQFRFKDLGQDIAIGVGTGIRLDFDYFLVRLDLGIKLKDPARLENNGWLDIGNFTWRNKEYTPINPLTGKPVYRNNYALQLGIGLPF
ncbi:MAG: BamA/TamA family outer membrane protein [Chitinophagaceae bacterium]